MKTNTAALAKALAALAPVASKRTTLPVLNTVRVEAKNGVLTLQATNLECHVSLDVECTGRLDAACVPARVFRNVVGFGLDTELSLVKGRLHVKTESSAIEIPVLDAADFPPCLEVKESPLAVDCAALATAIEKAGYAFSTDISRWALHNVMFDHEKGTLYVCTSDGKRLAMAAIECAVDMHVSVPADVIPQFLPALQSKDASLRMNENWMRVDHEEGFTMVKLAESKPVNFRQAVPVGVEPLGTVGRTELLAALDMCAGFAVESQCGVVMTPDKNGLKLFMQSDLGTVETVVAGKLRKVNKTKADVNFMRTAVRHLSGDTIPLIYEDEKSPIVMTEDNITAVVMPLLQK